MYKISSLLLTFSFFSLAQLRLCTPLGNKIKISKRVLHDCKTLNRLFEVPHGDDPITLGCSAQVPCIFLKNIFRGKSIENLTLYQLCCLLHVGVYTENNKWIHYAQSHLLPLLSASAKSFTKQLAVGEITSSFEKLQDTQSLRMLSEYYIKNNPNKFYEYIATPRTIGVNSRWSCIGIQAMNTSSCSLWVDKKNQNLFAVDSDTTTNIWIPLICSNVYPTTINNVIIAQHGSKLYSYNISTQQYKLLCSSYLDDINIHQHILTGWQNLTLFYWNLLSGEHYTMPFDISNVDVRFCIYIDTAHSAFVVSNNITTQNKMIIINDKMREEIPLLSRDILRCLSTPDGNYSAIEYDEGTVQVVDIKNKKTTIVHTTNRAINHFSVSSDGFYWLLVYESHNNNPPMSILYIPSTQTKKYIPMGTIDSVLIAQFNKQDDIELLVKNKDIHQQLLIKIDNLMALSATSLEKLTKI